MSYYENYKISDALLKSMFLFCKVRTLCSGRANDTGLITEESAKDVENLKNLLRVYKKVAFRADQNCVLNPTFGKGSALVGGADADLIIDDILLKIKTSICTSLKRVHFDQVFCYYIPFLIGGLRPKGYIKKINRIGIYYARHGILWQAKISDIANKMQVNLIKNFMVNRFFI